MNKMMMAALTLLMSLPVFSQTNFRSISFEEAVNAAKAEKKLVFIDFYTTWCVPCKKMSAEVFPQTNVGEYMNATFVNIKLNAEKEGKKLADLYNVKAFPTFVVVDTNQKEVVRSVGFKPADDFVADMKRMLNPETSPEKLEAAYKSGVRNAKLIQDYTNSMMEGVNDRDEFLTVANKAYEIVQDYFKNLSDEERLKEENLFIYRNYSTQLDVPSSKFMAQNVKKFPESVRQELSNIVQKLYDDEVNAYFTAANDMDKQKLSSLKSDIKAANLNTDNKYDLQYKFIDAYMKGDKSKYLDFCTANFKKLSDQQKAVLVNGFLRMFYKDGKDIRQKASKFLRSQLADMDANSLYYAAMQIGQFEKE